MGLKAGLQLLQQAGKVATKYTDNVVGGIGIRNLTKPISLEGLRLAPESIGDTVKFSQNNYLQNIKKIGLNQEDRNLLETLLSKSKCSEYLQEMFNEVMSRKDLNISELRELLTGEYVDRFLFGGGKIYFNQALMDMYFEPIMQRLKTLQPNDLKIIKLSDVECLDFFLQKNKLGDFIFSDDLFKKISKIEQLDDFFISNNYSPIVGRRIITGSIGKQKIFTYDPQEGLLKFFDDISPTERITTTRYLDGNEMKTLRDTAISKDKEVLLEETRCIKNSSGEATESIKYIKSDIDGAFNVTKTDLKTGKQIHCSKAFIDKNGNKIIQQSLVSPLGTKTNINYLETPNGIIEYSYKSIDSQGSLLTENIRTRTILNDSEILYKINGHSFNVKFHGTDIIEIFDNVTKQKNIIDLKALLKNIAIEDRQKMISMLKKVPADELLALNKNGVKQILSMDIDASSTFLGSDVLISSPNLFVFLHELGHKKDMVKLKFSDVERDDIKKFHVFMAKGKSSVANDTPFPNISQEESEKIALIEDKLTNLGNLSSKSKISSNSDLLKIYNKERTAYINRFGKDDRRIDYFIKQGSGLGCEGEVIAEINALLAIPISERALGLRSYLLAENFPETIAYAQKLLLNLN